MKPAPFFDCHPILWPRVPAPTWPVRNGLLRNHPSSEPWKTALKRLAAIPLVFAVFAAFVGLSHALR
jgi:hypothetical protein